MNVIIIEDEQLMARNLEDNLKQIDPAIHVRAVLSSISQARIYFAENDQPDLIFSDIQLGDGLSFEIFAEDHINAPVIFCTAYDEYALDAFKANGIDYILKPFTNLALHHTLQKYRLLNKQFIKQYHLFHTNQVHRKSAILVYQNERIIPLPVANIAVCFIQNKTTMLLCFDHQVYMVGQPLDELENICSEQFYRASRQYLVNRAAIREVAHYYARKLILKLTVDFKDNIIISKERYTSFLQWLSH